MRKVTHITIAGAKGTYQFDVDFEDDGTPFAYWRPYNQNSQGGMADRGNDWNELIASMMGAVEAWESD